MSKGGFLGSYSDLKTVKTRSVVQVVIEVPIERAREVTDLLGWPVPGEEVAVAIARIDLAKVSRPEVEYKPTKLATLAGILSNEGGFNTWASEHGYSSGKDYIYDRCSVTSRRDLDTNDEAAARFRDMKAEYDLWLRGMAA